MKPVRPSVEAAVSGTNVLAASSIPWRWVAIGVFTLSSTINYLDRQLLAAVAPSLKSEFHLSNLQYGQIVSAFSVVYASIAPVAGLVIDRVGLSIGITLPVILWSIAGSATGLVQSIRGLIATRIALGIGESAGIPSAAKATASYLRPKEFAFGNASNQVGISMGAILAPLIVSWLTPTYGWRSVFVLCGLLGLFWIPLWLLASRHMPARRETNAEPVLPLTWMLNDRRLWGLVISNALVMTLYSLWTNWTTIYFVQERQVSQLDANQHFAWIPPVFATLGGFFGGWLAFFWIGRGMAAIRARMRIGWLGAILALTTASVPFMPTAGLAAAVISMSFFWSMSLQANLHVIHIDFWGPKRAAFGASLLTCSYALMQTFLSPFIGFTVDRFGFSAVCIVLAVCPLFGIFVLRGTMRKRIHARHA